MCSSPENGLSSGINVSPETAVHSDPEKDSSHPPAKPKVAPRVGGSGVAPSPRKPPPGAVAVFPFFSPTTHADRKQIEDQEENSNSTEDKSKSDSEHDPDMTTKSRMQRSDPGLQRAGSYEAALNTDVCPPQPRHRQAPPIPLKPPVGKSPVGKSHEDSSTPQGSDPDTNDSETTPGTKVAKPTRKAPPPKPKPPQHSPPKPKKPQENQVNLETDVTTPQRMEALQNDPDHHDDSSGSWHTESLADSTKAKKKKKSKKSRSGSFLAQMKESVSSNLGIGTKRKSSSSTFYCDVADKEVVTEETVPVVREKTERKRNTSSVFYCDMAEEEGNDAKEAESSIEKTIDPDPVVDHAVDQEQQVKSNAQNEVKEIPNKSVSGYQVEDGTSRSQSGANADIDLYVKAGDIAPETRDSDGGLQNMANDSGNLDIDTRGGDPIGAAGDSGRHAGDPSGDTGEPGAGQEEGLGNYGNSGKQQASGETPEDNAEAKPIADSDAVREETEADTCSSVQPVQSLDDLSPSKNKDAPPSDHAAMDKPNLPHPGPDTRSFKPPPRNKRKSKMFPKAALEKTSAAADDPHLTKKDDNLPDVPAETEPSEHIEDVIEEGSYENEYIEVADVEGLMQTPVNSESEQACDDAPPALPPRNEDMCAEKPEKARGRRLVPVRGRPVAVSDDESENEYIIPGQESSSDSDSESELLEADRIDQGEAAASQEKYSSSNEMQNVHRTSNQKTSTDSASVPKSPQAGNSAIDPSGPSEIHSGPPLPLIQPKSKCSTTLPAIDDGDGDKKSEGGGESPNLKEGEMTVVYCTKDMVDHSYGNVQLVVKDGQTGEKLSSSAQSPSSSAGNALASPGTSPITPKSVRSLQELRSASPTEVYTPMECVTLDGNQGNDVPIRLKGLRDGDRPASWSGPERDSVDSAAYVSMETESHYVNDTVVSLRKRRGSIESASSENDSNTDSDTDSETSRESLQEAILEVRSAFISWLFLLHV